LDLREIGFGDIDWINLAQDRNQCKALVNTAIKCWKVVEHLHNWQLLEKSSAP
jgi:hypothetical protein